ncbi:MAG: hypothetical protein AABW46_01620 [Nanoarchaeota archaeon]
MKKRALSLLMTAMLMITVLPVYGVDAGTGIGIDITPEEFAPLIWMCDERRVVEDCVEAGRTSDCSNTLFERTQNYAFEGEQIEWLVLVMDKNKIEQIQEVVGTIGDTQGEGNDIEVECARTDRQGIEESCNARILEEELTEFNPDVMAYYECIFTVETPDSMYGEYFVTIEAISTDGSATMDENEFWFLNPVVAVTIDGDVVFEDVRPGAVSYSDTILVGNDADEGSGVLLDMFVSGTDFYDPDSSGAKCPVSNRLKLSQDLRSQVDLGDGTASGATFTEDCNADAVGTTGTDNADHLCYFATSGAYDTIGNANSDAEGYRPIVYSDQFTRDFYNDAEIINDLQILGTYWAGNFLAPGAEIAVTFKLALPEPCVGDFSDGDIFFWGEAI